MSNELRKAAQDEINDLIGWYWDIAYEEGKTGVSQGDRADYVLGQINAALRAALATCSDCGKPTPEGSVHTCSPQKPDAAKQRLLEIMRRNGLATGHGDTLTQVIDELESELTDVLSAARQNAARYRWLRDVSDTEFMEELSDTFFGEWDAVIDAAMQQEQGK